MSSLSHKTVCTLSNLIHKSFGLREIKLIIYYSFIQLKIFSFQIIVFCVTSFFSVFAYIWLLIVLKWVSPDEVEIW